MFFDVGRVLPRPKSVLTRFYNTYVVVALISIIIIISEIFRVVFYYWLGYPQLIVITLISITCWICVYAFNRSGKHQCAVALIALNIYLLAIGQIFYIGWDAGFQYHLVALMAILLLYPHPNKKLLPAVAVLIIATFISVYYFSVQLETNFSEKFIHSLHTFNALISMIVLGVANFYFRTNIAELIEKLNLCANTDLLTNLINRRGMNFELKRHSSLLTRAEHKNTLILIDIDDFKNVNDIYGHGAGDAVLEGLASTIKKPASRNRFNFTLGRRRIFNINALYKSRKCNCYC